jgi:hypothetical protein
MRDGLLRALQIRRKRRLAGDDWRHYEYPRDDGSRGFVIFDAEVAERPGDPAFGACRRVVVLVDGARAGIYLSDETHSELSAEVDLLTDELVANDVACLLVAVHRHSSRVEYVFQVGALPAFEAALAQWSARVPLRIEVIASSGWGHYDDELRPDERDLNYMTDLQVLENLKTAGSRFELEHVIEHVFMGTAAQLGEITDALVPRGFRVTERYDDTIVLSREVMIRNMDISDTTLPLRRLAKVVGATYDGWSATVMR